MRVGAKPAIDASGKVYFPMMLPTKAAILFVCALLCTLGLIFSPKENAPESFPDTQLLPVKNQQPHRGIWLRV